MNSRGRLLVLDGQTPQALAVVRSLGRAGRTVFVASARRRPLAAWSRYCQQHKRVEDESVTAFARLRTWAHHLGVQVVLPLTERSCLLCNAERDAWEAAGIRVGCGPDQMLRGAFDKAETLRRAAACGVPFPDTRFPESLDQARAAAEELGFPCVVKARMSYSWNGDRIHSTPPPVYLSRGSDLERAILARHIGGCWPLLQRYVEGTGRGIFALCSRGRPIGWFAHERLREIDPTGSGSSLRRSIRAAPQLVEPARRLLDALQWHGPVMLEFRDGGDRGLWLIEVNGRFWGSLALAIAAGADFPLMWAQLLDGETPDAPVYRTGVTVRWLWGDVKRFIRVAAGAPRGFPGPFPTRLQGLRELLGPQPPGTEIETWAADDPWPAMGEWIQGIGEAFRLARTCDAQSQAAAPALPRSREAASAS